MEKRAIVALLMVSSLSVAEQDAHQKERPPEPVSEKTSTPNVRPPSTAPAEVLFVRVRLTSTSLTKIRIKEALEREFGMDIVLDESRQSLNLDVNGRILYASHRGETNELVERTVTLPRSEPRQLDTIALLAGNIARDEASKLLASLRPSSLPLAEKNSPRPSGLGRQTSRGRAKPDEPVRSALTPLSKRRAPGSAPSSREAATAKGRPQPTDLPREQTLERVPFSIGIVAGVAVPGHLDDRIVRLHGGLFHSKFANVQGVAGSVFLLENKGRGRPGTGRGAQIAGIWIGGSGPFKGLSASGVASTQKGGGEGAQAAGVLAYQENDHRGAQIGGIAAVSNGTTIGTQIGGILSWSSTRLEGAQIGGVAAYSGGVVQGTQVSLLGFANKVDGAQIGFVNYARTFDGSQVGLLNYSGEFEGPQVGLINIAHHADSQIGLINIARDVRRSAVAPINIVPSARHQIVGYTSQSAILRSRTDDPDRTTESTLTHVALKIMPGSAYTQLNFGVGSQLEGCPTNRDSQEEVCLRYATGLAMGARKILTRNFYLEFDGQYQFENAFEASSTKRHSLLARSAVGYELNRNFSAFAGLGPRFNLRATPRSEEKVQGDLGLHLFAGMTIF